MTNLLGSRVSWTEGNGKTYYGNIVAVQYAVNDGYYAMLIEMSDGLLTSRPHTSIRIVDRS